MNLTKRRISNEAKPEPTGVIARRNRTMSTDFAADEQTEVQDASARN
jgi:hypothetical protein